jgi:flagellar biosynthetic protein FliP
MMYRLIAPAALLIFVPSLAFAAAADAAVDPLTIDLTGGGAMTERLIQIVAVVTVLSLAPSILMMTTCFTRIVVVLSLLRSAIGIQQSPPNSVIVSLALFLTFFVMAPTFTTVYADAITPLVEQQISTDEALTRASAPMRTFMQAHTREQDLGLFLSMAQATPEPP